MRDMGLRKINVKEMSGDEIVANLNQYVRSLVFKKVYKKLNDNSLKESLKGVLDSDYREMTTDLSLLGVIPTYSSKLHDVQKSDLMLLIYHTFDPKLGKEVPADFKMVLFELLKNLPLLAAQYH